MGDQITLKKAATSGGKFQRMVRNYIRTLQQYDPDMSYYAPMWNDQRSADFLLIKKNSETAGFACAKHLEYIGKEFLYIEEFYISPEFRQQGIGTDAVKELARKYDYLYVMFNVLDNNERAKSFWTAAADKCGWERQSNFGLSCEGCETRIYKRRGAFEDDTE